VRPSCELYVPGSQILHVVIPTACAYPLLQEHDACDALPDADTAFAWHGTHDELPTVCAYVWFGHSAHAALPGCALNDPAKHAEHTPPSGPV